MEAKLNLVGPAILQNRQVYTLGHNKSLMHHDSQEKIILKIHTFEKIHKCFENKASESLELVILLDRQF